MLYLGQIHRQLFKPQIELLAIQRTNIYWEGLNKAERINIPSGLTDLGDGAIVVASLSLKRQVIQIKPAKSELPQILENLSQTIQQELSRSLDVELWRESLEYQAVELQRRSEILEELEAQLRMRELRLIDAIATLNLAKVQLNREKEAYATAWGHLQDQQSCSKT